LGILACLFALCALAPRSWRPSAERPQSGAAEAPVARRASLAPTAAEDELPQPPSSPLVEPQTASRVAAEKPSPEWSEKEGEVLPPAPAGEILATSATENSTVETAAEPDEPARDVTVRVSSPSDRLAMRPSRPARPKMELPPDQPTGAEPAPSAEPAEPGWSLPKTLLARLDELAAQEATADWAAAAARDARSLVVAPYEPETAEALLESLDEATRRGRELARSPQAASLQTEVLRAVYGLRRRLDIWRLVYAARPAQMAPLALRPGEKRLSRSLSALAVAIDGGEIGQSWRGYLLLDSLQALLDRGPLASDRDRRELANRVLDRIATARRSETHRQFVTKGPIDQLDAALRAWSTEPVETPELLAHLERYEASGATDAARQLAEDYRSLLWSSAPEHHKLARQLERHYRNANLRIAVTDEFLNHCLPQQPLVRSRIDDRILGAKVRGESATSTRLHIRLLPGQGRLRVGLQAMGLVQSTTASSSGPAVFHSLGRTQYVAEKVIDFSAAGLTLWPAVSEARAANDLLNFNTDFDQVPLFGSLARSVILLEHDDAHDDALREMEWRVARTARQRMDREADRKIHAAAKRFETKILDRLGRLSLEPEPLELQTTDERLVMRLRLAAGDQLAAHTPRPRALSNSLASLQLHVSVLNNAIEQFDLRGRTFKLAELYRHLGERLDVELPPPDDLPAETTVTFAAKNPIVARLREGRVQITLSLAEIAQPRRKYRYFQVHAFYRPETDGMTVQLVRDESIRLAGRDLGFGDQLVLRSVFSKVFSKNRPLPLIPAKAAADPRLAGLEINQLVIEDGWIGLSIARSAEAK
jgi:hypothetical protein